MDGAADLFVIAKHIGIIAAVVVISFMIIQHSKNSIIKNI